MKLHVKNSYLITIKNMENEEIEDEQEEDIGLSDEYTILQIIDDLFQNIDNILYRRHIDRVTHETVLNAFEDALFDVMNLFYIGETFDFLCTPKTFQLGNDLELAEIPKDSLQV